MPLLHSTSQLDCSLRKRVFVSSHSLSPAPQNFCNVPKFAINQRVLNIHQRHLLVQASEGDSQQQSSFPSPPAVQPSSIAASSVGTEQTSRNTSANRSVNTSVSTAQGASPSQPAKPPPPPAKKKKNDKKTPWQQKVLNGILGISNVPYSSYVPEPATFLHEVDARIKQIWLVALYFMIARASIPVRIGVAGMVAVVSMITLPPRLWISQLSRLGLLAAFIFVMTALAADGVPAVLQPRDVPGDVEGIGAVPPTGYNYVILHAWVVTITHRSVNLAVTGAALTFCALQTASLCLITTPGEEMAMALRWWLQPLKWLKVPVQEVALTLLLSLRFLSLVFEEVRNLCLGLAARGVDWAAHGFGGSISLAGRLCLRLFANLFHRSENMAQAMLVRGFQGPEQQNLYMMSVNQTSVVANGVALAALVGLFFAVAHFK